MEIPKFLMGDHSDRPDDIFIIHTEYPQFIINLVDDEITWLEDLVGANEDELADEVINLIEAASTFYDEQVQFYDNESSNK